MPLVSNNLQNTADSRKFLQSCPTLRITGFTNFVQSSILETREHNVLETRCFCPQVRGSEDTGLGLALSKGPPE
jgi:hypothetical protein